MVVGSVDRRRSKYCLPTSVVFQAEISIADPVWQHGLHCRPRITPEMAVGKPMLVHSVIARVSIIAPRSRDLRFFPKAFALLGCVDIEPDILGPADSSSMVAMPDTVNSG